MNKDGAKDIVQDVFVKLYLKKDRSVIENLKTYLYRAVANECLNYRKKEDAERRHAKLYHCEIDESFVDESMRESEQADKIFRAVERLSPQTKKIFMMSRYDNMKNSEIAVKLRISVRTVETHIS